MKVAADCARDTGMGSGSRFSEGLLPFASLSKAFPELGVLESSDSLVLNSCFEKINFTPSPVQKTTHLLSCSIYHGANVGRNKRKDIVE